MKYYILMIFIVLFSCNSSLQKTNLKAVSSKFDDCFKYPAVIESLHLQNLYDSARWYIYTDYCDVPYQPKSDNLLNIPYGELELKFDNSFIQNDTASFFFNFIFKGEDILPDMLRVRRPLQTGIAFRISTKEKLYVIGTNVFITYKGDPRNRFINPMQPEVVSYIKQNWNKLDNCFRELAKKKGLSN